MNVTMVMMVTTVTPTKICCLGDDVYQGTQTRESGYEGDNINGSRFSNGASKNNINSKCNVNGNDNKNTYK
eukprot:10945508-Ditylum_brightwellii.AAC.1